MRSPLLLSAAVLALGVAFAATGVQAQTAPSTDASGFNTSGPGMTNTSNPGGVSAGGSGPSSERARLNPDDAANKQGAATSRSLDPSSFNTAGPGQSNETSVSRTTVPDRVPTGAQLRAAGNPGDAAQTFAPGTTATQSTSGFNTSDPAATNSSNPAAPAR